MIFTFYLYDCIQYKFKTEDFVHLKCSKNNIIEQNLFSSDHIPFTLVFNGYISKVSQIDNIKNCLYLILIVC